jgi:hypothetical protein
MAVDEQKQNGGVKKGVKEEDLKLHSQRLAVPRLEFLPPCAWVHAQVRRAVRLCAQLAPGCRVRTFSINTHDGTEQNRAARREGNRARLPGLPSPCSSSSISSSRTEAASRCM